MSTFINSQNIYFFPQNLSNSNVKKTWQIQARICYTLNMTTSTGQMDASVTSNTLRPLTAKESFN